MHQLMVHRGFCPQHKKTTVRCVVHARNRQHLWFPRRLVRQHINARAPAAPSAGARPDVACQPRGVPPSPCNPMCRWGPPRDGNTCGSIPYRSFACVCRGGAAMPAPFRSGRCDV